MSRKTKNTSGRYVVKNPFAHLRKMKHGNRTVCIGGCGTMVLEGQGECRDCRRARVRAGKKHMAKINNFIPVRTPAFETSKQKYDRVRHPRR